MAEQPMPEPYGSQEPRLRYLSEADISSGEGRDPRLAAKLAEQHAWLAERMTARVAARWPDEVDVAWVRSHAMVALRQAATRVEDEEDLPVAGVRAIHERLRTLLAGTQWYREAMLGRARPLCEAWRGAILAGREPSDHTLCARLKLSREELAQRFVELATVFAVEPAALMPGDTDPAEGIALAVGSLDGEQRLVASLYFQQQLTLAEIADVMGLLPVRVQELFGRAAAAIAGESTLAAWQITA